MNTQRTFLMSLRQFLVPAPTPIFPTPTQPPSHTIDWIGSSPFLVIHLLSLGVFFFEFKWQWVVLALASYALRMFGITAGLHRYVSHRAYGLNRFWQFWMLFLAETSVQKGGLWWAANHRYHHKHSDEAVDIHSPSRDGFWWSHLGWILSKDYTRTRWELIQDLSKFPELRFLNRFWIIPVASYGAAIYLLWGWAGFFWGFLLSTTILWHGTFTINSLSHVFGSQRYESRDTSRNNFALALITLGEGWHNNHHTYLSSANQGFFWWEIDFSFYTLKILSWMGIAKNLRLPPLEQLDARRIRSRTPVRAIGESAV